MSVAAIVDRPFRLRIQKSSFISPPFPSRDGGGNFKIRNAQYFLPFLSLYLFFRTIFPGNRLSLPLSMLALSQAYKIAAGKAQVEGDAAPPKGVRRREKGDAFTFKFLRN